MSIECVFKYCDKYELRPVDGGGFADIYKITIIHTKECGEKNYYRQAVNVKERDGSKEARRILEDWADDFIKTKGLS